MNGGHEEPTPINSENLWSFGNAHGHHLELEFSLCLWIQMESAIVWQ